MSPAADARVRLASADRLGRRRTLAAIGFGVALLGLMLASGWYVSAARAEQASRDALARAEIEAAEARDRLALRGKQRALSDALGSLAREAESRGLAPRFWSERRITLNEMRYDRPTANDVVVSTANGRGRVFDTEAFELSVFDPNESLFQLPAGEGQPLRVTLRGNAMFSTREVD